MTTRRRAFTLTELLVAIAIIGILAAITVVGIRAISKDAKLASGKNTLMAVLEGARARAIKNRQIVLVVFRPQLIAPDKQVIEAVQAQWTGEVYINTSIFSWTSPIDRFTPIPDAPVRTFPGGIKLAGPTFYDSVDENWTTLSHLPEIDQSTGGGEQLGSMLAVMYAADGTMITRNPRTDSSLSWVDFDGDLLMDAYDGEFAPAAVTWEYFDQRAENEEPFVTVVPFFAVYDDDEARELKGLPWDQSAGGLQNYQDELTGPLGYITSYADRIHFNRYTGVAMK